MSGLILVSLCDLHQITGSCVSTLVLCLACTSYRLRYCLICEHDVVKIKQFLPHLLAYNLRLGTSISVLHALPQVMVPLATGLVLVAVPVAWRGNQAFDRDEIVTCTHKNSVIS